MKTDARRAFLPLNMLPQPDDTTCGPTCLHAVLRFWGEKISLPAVIDRVPTLDHGGTLAVHLGTVALELGYDALIYTYNLQTFDPSWFKPPRADLARRLGAQLEVKTDPKLAVSTAAYLEFLDAGGRLEFADLTSSLLMHHLRAGEPLITGLSATYLYQAMRERPDETPDDIGGDPVGHFVAISGFDKDERTAELCDPYHADPSTGELRYTVRFSRLICAIMLGVLTYDANLLVVRPRRIHK